MEVGMGSEGPMVILLVVSVIRLLNNVFASRILKLSGEMRGLMPLILLR